MALPFKYVCRFSEYLTASTSSPKELVSQASLDSLREVIPEEIDFQKNIDLLGVAFNGALANRFNKNGDGIDSQTAIAIKDYFIHKPTNIEHEKQKVVGHIVSSSFSEIGSSDMLSREVVAHRRDPFNISLGALVYKIVNPAFTNMLEESNEGEEYHNVVSASWEIGFNDFYIAVGSDNLNEAESDVSIPHV